MFKIKIYKIKKGRVGCTLSATAVHSGGGGDGCEQYQKKKKGKRTGTYLIHLPTCHHGCDHVVGGDVYGGGLVVVVAVVVV